MDFGDDFNEPMNEEKPKKEKAKEDDDEFDFGGEDLDF